MTVPAELLRGAAACRRRRVANTSRLHDIGRRIFASLAVRAAHDCLTTALLHNSALAILHATCAVLVELRYSPSWSLCDSNTGQSGNDDLLGLRERESRWWVLHRGYSPSAAGTPLPFSRRIPQPSRRTPPIGMFTIRGCRTW